MEYSIKRWNDQLDRIIQDMNEIGGTADLYEYIAVLEQLEKTIQHDLKKARELSDIKDGAQLTRVANALGNWPDDKVS